MSRRRAHHDPVEARATDVADGPRFNAALNELLEALSPDDQYLIKRVTDGLSLRRIARDDGISPLVVRFRFNKAVSMLRHPSRGRALTIWSHEELHGVVRHLQETALRSNEQADLQWCDRHGWTERIGRPMCLACPCEIPTDLTFGASSFGRPRRYCCNACRQRAYRHRRTNPAAPGRTEPASDRTRGAGEEEA